MQNRSTILTTTLSRTMLFASGTLALALAAGPITARATDEDTALAAAIQKHFNSAPQTAEAPANAVTSVDAMVAYFTSAPPPGDVTVASRRHVDLDVKFAFDSDAIDDAGIAQLDVAGKALQNPQLRGRRFMLAGHTDDRGDQAYNLDLSLRRAESARQYLINEYSVEPERLDAAGFGSEQPHSEEKTTESRRLNRRVVLEMVE